MSDSFPTKKELSIGDTVLVKNRENVESKGVIAEFLTNADTHPHGIMVKLESGESGRVQTVLEAEILVSAEPRIVEDVTENFLLTAVESLTIELKSGAFWSTRLNKEDIEASRSPEVKAYGQKASLFIVARGVASFLNTEGGQLIIGVEEMKDGSGNNIVGIGPDYAFLKDKTLDGYKRRLRESIFEPYFPKDIVNSLHSFVEISFVEIGENTLCILDVERSNEPITIEANSEPMFFVRGDPLTKKLKSDEIIAYLKRRFD